MFKLVSLNLNGIRSATSKGLEDWVAATSPHCICVQELKAQALDVAGKFEELAGMKGYFHYAQKKGYSGVAVYARHEPSDVVIGIGHTEFDDEGRYVELRFDTPARKFSLISAYFPSGSSSEERQEAKFRFLDLIYPRLAAMSGEREYVLCGDVNIAHHEKDLKNWKGNLKNSGFLPEERAWMTEVFDDLGFVDAFRLVNQKPDQYTWWSNRGRAWENNVGWRIDYQIVSPALAATVRGATIYKRKRFSDHAPLIMDYEIDGS